MKMFLKFLSVYHIIVVALSLPSALSHEKRYVPKIHYDNFKPSNEVEKNSSKLFTDSWYFWGQADLLGNMAEGLSI